MLNHCPWAPQGAVPGFKGTQWAAERHAEYLKGTLKPTGQKPNMVSPPHLLPSSSAPSL